MRAAPAFQISLHRFEVWRVAVLLLAWLGVAAIAVWFIAREQAIDSATAGAAASALLALGWLAISTARVPATTLRWDGRRWNLGVPGSAPDHAVPADLTAVIDLGPWMLLRFKPVEKAARMPVGWLPVQRRGIETQWHGLRCAIYSPRPAPGADPLTGG